LANALPELKTFLSPYKQEYIEMAEINMKYDGYIQKESDMVEKMNRLENLHLSELFDYRAITALSNEARDKLSKMRPLTIGQASRISGVSPADVSVLLIHLGR
jgi:tRNA uridine 5-carboxymethylaminomethyl modification enzyme